VPELSEPAETWAEALRVLHGARGRTEPSAFAAEAERAAREVWRDLVMPEETVNHPAHYGGDTVYEVIKVIEAWALGFHLGNAVKYIARAGRKSTDQLVDLEKARWYLDRYIKQRRKK
jgi:hypothetical protein